MRPAHAPISRPGEALAAFVRTVQTEVRALDVSPRALRQFGRVVGGVLSFLGALLLWRRGVTPATLVLLGAGGALVVVGLVAPRALGPVYRVWMTAAFAMGFVMTRVILAVFYFLVLTPAGLLRRTFGKSPVLTRPDPDIETYWIRRPLDPATPKERLERMY